MTCAAEVAEVVADPEAGIVIVCGLGGVMEVTAGGSTAVQSRSLIAAYELLDAGYKRLRVLRDGMRGWNVDGRDIFVKFEGDADIDELK